MISEFTKLSRGKIGEQEICPKVPRPIPASRSGIFYLYSQLYCLAIDVVHRLAASTSTGNFGNTESEAHTRSTEIKSMFYQAIQCPLKLRNYWPGTYGIMMKTWG